MTDTTVLSKFFGTPGTISADELESVLKFYEEFNEYLTKHVEALYGLHVPENFTNMKRHHVNINVTEDLIYKAKWYLARANNSSSSQ